MQLQPEAAKAALQLIQDMKAVAGKGFQASLAKLEAEITRMTTEIEVLRMVGPSPAIDDLEWFKYGLTEAERRMLLALQRAGDAGATKDRVMAAMYSDHVGDEPGVKILDVRVCHIRRKLEAAKAPYWIETIHSTGWVLRKGKPPAATQRPVKFNGSKRWCRSSYRPVIKPKESIAA